jgi:DNA-binding response OmpR family regulator
MPKVMLIDDDATILSLLQTLLEFEGFQVLQLNGEGDPDEIMSQFHLEKPDLVLLDVHLHHISGFDLLHLIRQNEELDSVRVLMSSGMELSSKCAQEGADGFILKPYMPDELVKKIQTTLST